MFRDDYQRARARVCNVLTSWISGYVPHWRPDGSGDPVPRPTNLALKIAARGAGRSGSEVAMMRIAVALWSGRSEKTWGSVVYAMLHSFDNRNMERLGSLLVAISSGAEAIDQWIDRHEHYQRWITSSIPGPR